jgi:4-amino-4-deoxy-L-arabinose transferase-like glycosyltransferase
MPTLALKVDAVVEGVLAIVLVFGALVGFLRGDDFPSPVNGVVVALVGLALIPVAIFLWRLGSAERVPKRTLRVIATANAVTALLLGIWLFAADGFSDAGRAVTAATVAALFVLAALQFSWSLVPQD